MLIVTAYYNIPSKQPSSFYYEHIRRFFKFVKAPVLFFTDEENHRALKHSTGDNITFHIQPFECMTIFKEFPVDFWKYQITKDPEKYHTWQLGALWSNKSGFVKQAAELYPTNEWYMWVDCGSLRNDSWKPYMNDFGKRHVPSHPGVYIQQIRDIPEDKYFKYPFYAVAGSHILFHKDYISKFIECYHSMLRYYESENVSLIMDQYIMASLITQKKMDNLFTIRNNLYCPDEWFFFYVLF